MKTTVQKTMGLKYHQNVFEGGLLKGSLGGGILTQFLKTALNKKIPLFFSLELLNFLNA